MERDGFGFPATTKTSLASGTLRSKLVSGTPAEFARNLIRGIKIAKQLHAAPIEPDL